MLIVCPNCATSYAITAPALGPRGRTVRCVRCRTQWFAAPQPDPSVSAHSISTYVDDIIAEAEAQPASDAPETGGRLPPAPDLSAQNWPAQSLPPVQNLPPVAPPPAAAPEHDPARIAAALNQLSIIEPMSADDLAQIDPPGDAALAAEIGDAPPIVPPPEPIAAPMEPGQDDIEHFAAQHAQRQRTRRRRERATKIPALLVALALIAGAILLWRNDLVRHVPQTASLFSAIGLPVNVRGLVFEGVTVSKESNDGLTVLVVEGRIVSSSGKPAEVPRLRFAVRNAAGAEIYSWTAQPSRSVLGPGETLPFRSRLASPPPEGVDVMVRFFNPHDLANGMK